VYSNRGAAHFRLGKILFDILFCVCLFEALRSAKNNYPENVVARSYAKTLALRPLRLHYESVVKCYCDENFVFSFPVFLSVISYLDPKFHESAKFFTI